MDKLLDDNIFFALFLVIYGSYFVAVLTVILAHMWLLRISSS